MGLNIVTGHFTEDGKALLTYDNDKEMYEFFQELQEFKHKLNTRQISLADAQIELARLIKKSKNYI